MLSSFLTVVPGVTKLLQDESPVLDHVLFQYLPQCRNGEVAVRIQLLEEPLPGHQHSFQIEKLKLQCVTCTDTVAVIY